MKTKQICVTFLVAVSLAGVGCGSEEQASTSTSTGNAADRAFIADMTTHHQGGIDMAKVALTKAEHPEIRALADQIVSTQQEEISAMKSIADLMGGAAGKPGGMGMSAADMGMNMDMGMLQKSKEFDRDFIDMMVPHHEGGIVMAQEVVKRGAEPTLRELATDIIAGQSGEIEQMRQWRKTWFGAESVSMEEMKGMANPE